MKAKVIFTSFIVVVFLGCDQVNQDAPPTINYTQDYFPNQPIVIRLNSYLAPESSKTFVISGSANDGKAEIINDSYLKYFSESQTTTNVLLDVKDKEGNLLSKARVSFVATDSKCGIAAPATFTIRSTESISMDVASADLVCEYIGQLMLLVEDVENTEGLSLTAPPAGPKDNPIVVHLSYTPPAGFRGKARVLYTLAINIKQQYIDQLSLPSLELAKHPEYFNHFVTGEVEINVID